MRRVCRAPAFLSFHSLEDELVKVQLKSLVCACPCLEFVGVFRVPFTFWLFLEQSHRSGAGADAARVVEATKRPLCPSQDEVAANPRARSAMLRVCQVK